MIRALMILICVLTTAVFSVAADPPPASPSPTPAPAPARAKYLITAADDFIVDVYHNGKSVPDSKRTLLREIHGATVERIDVEVKPGDWLVFNVVNNRMRWGGARYFGVAGCYAQNEFGFVSRPDQGSWSVCDAPRDVDRFISEKTYLRHQPAQEIKEPWGAGDELMREYAGSSWQGAPVWGHSRNTWIKMIVED